MGGFSYPDTFGYQADFFPDGVGAGIVGVIVFFYLIVLFLSFVFSVVSYILHSLGLYTIANRRGIRHGWLAWIPLGNLWILGSISDQYQYVAKGKVKNRRKVMLVLSIGVLVLYFIWLIAMVASMFSGEGLAAAAAGMAVGIFAMAVVGVILVVLQYLAYYDLFNSCHPGNAVLYLVFSILFSVTLPFLVFACRKKDGGMPPRKQAAPEQIVEAAEPAEEETAEQETEEGYAQPEEFEEE